MLRANSQNSSISSKTNTPRFSTKPPPDTKSLKSVPSKESTRIPKVRNIKDAKPVPTRGSKPPEDKKFSIHRTSRTVISEKSETASKPKSEPSSRPSTTSSLGKSMQQFGKVPSYLKRSSSIKREPDVTDKVKAFNNLKTKLRAAQSQFFKALGNVKQTQPDGLQEEYRFIALVKDGEGKLIMDETKDVPKIDGGLENKCFLSIKEKLSLMNKDVNLVLCSISDQVRSLQDHSSSLELTELRVDLADLQQKIEAITSTNRNHTVEVIKLLNDLADSSNVVIRELDNQELQSKLQQTTDLFETTKRKLDLAENKLADLKLKEQARTKVQELELKTKDKQSLDKDKELVRYRNEIKTLEEQKHKSTNDLSRLRQKMKALENELAQYRGKAEVAVDIGNIKSNLEGSEQKCSELEKLYNELKKCNAKLQNEFDDKQEELSKSLAELDSLKSREQSDSSKIAELTNEVRMLQFEKEDLKEELRRLQEDKEMLIEDFKSSNVNLEVKLGETTEQLTQLEKTNDDLRLRLLSVEEELAQKSALVSELVLKNEELSDVSKTKEMQKELEELREADIAKSREIRSLRLDLAKTIHGIKQREEEILLYQRVLKVRTELINSMQDKEHSSDLKISDLYSEIGKQSSYITQVNNQLAHKSEELQNIFTNLEKKKIELARQEQTMKQLEESNQRSFEIQKSQVMRIQQLDDEIAKLKETVHVYEKHLLGLNDANRNNAQGRS